MHILFLTDNFPPEVNAPASRTFEHCREWVRLGHKVTVITCAPNFPAGKVYEGYRNRWRSREIIDGIDVIRVWTYITANENFLKRTLDYASFMASSIPAAIGVKNVDIIVATSPQLFTPCAAWVVSLFKNRPYIFELRDLWPESIRAVGAMKNSRVLDALESLELFLYRRAARIISVTHSFKENLISRGIASEKIDVVTNGVDLSRFQPMPRDETLARKLGLEDKFVVGYIGTHGMAHALQTLLRAAERLKTQRAAHNVRFLFLGNGAEKATLEAWAKEHNLDNVLFVDSVPRNEVVHYWSLVDVSVIHLKHTPLFETVIPSKMFECMALGIPILHGVVGESARLIESESAGICFEPENDLELSHLILELVETPDQLDVLAKNGRAAAVRYDRAALATDMLQSLEGVAALETVARPAADEAV
ncbi:MAG: glycosyltransferase family 4 protein [Hyphomicrobiaceae bacterium]